MPTDDRPAGGGPGAPRRAAPPSPVAVAVTGCCPRCGRGRLFPGPFTLGLAAACASCGLDYTFADPGDGPAVFAIMLLGAMVLAGAMIAEFRYGVPLWGHVLLWGISTPVIAFALLRVLKGGLVALQWRNKAAEARFGDGAE